MIQLNGCSGATDKTDNVTENCIELLKPHSNDIVSCLRERGLMKRFKKPHSVPI